jgi:hypothetical protein
MTTIRNPAVAGTFYPAEPGVLVKMVGEYLDEVRTDAAPPKAMVVPHAGYVYSGPVAASAYARLRNADGQITRVVLLGPSHRVPFYGIATPASEQFQTPLGMIDIDRDAINGILPLQQVYELDAAHEAEHSLEVQLPFLQQTLGDFQLVPLVVGQASSEEVAEVLSLLWGGPETLIVISSDLSHYLDYDAAKSIDAATSRSIERLDAAQIGDDQACGRIPLKGLLLEAQRRGMQGETIDLRNSGDTAGPRDHVVGYGAYVFN